MIASLDALRELDLLCCGQERDAPNVLQEELERIGRDLGVGGLGLALDLLLGVDDGDLSLVQRGVELVELAGLEIELVERESDLVGVELAALEAGLEQALSLVGREDVLDRCSNRRAFRFPCDQSRPLARLRSHRSHRGGRRQSARSRTVTVTLPLRKTVIRSRGSRTRNIPEAVRSAACRGDSHPLFDLASRIGAR